MNDAALVRVSERICDGDRNPHRLVDGQLLFAMETRAKRLAFDERHDVVQQAVRFAGVEQREQVRMLEIRRDADLAQESLRPEDGAELGVEHFERDEPLMLEVAREVDRRHAAAAQLAFDDVRAREGGVQVIGRLQMGTSAGIALKCGSGRYAASRGIATLTTIHDRRSAIHDRFTLCLQVRASLEVHSQSAGKRHHLESLWAPTIARRFESI